MRKNTLLYLLIGGGIAYYIYKNMQLGKQTKVSVQRPYTLEVAEAEKITEQQFRTPELLKKIAPAAKKLLAKAAAKRKKKVGYFPDTF
jgi:hypothetical protein